MEKQTIYMDLSEKENFIMLLDKFKHLNDDNGSLKRGIDTIRFHDSIVGNKSYNPDSIRKTKEYFKCVTVVFNCPEFETFLRKEKCKFHYDQGQLFFL